MKGALVVRVYYEDTDAGGVVYYANYLKYLERGRTELFRNLGFEQDALLQENVVFAVKHVDIAYQHPARFNDILTVSTVIDSIGKASIYFTQNVTKATQMITKAKVQIVCLALDTFTPQGIPRKIVTALEKEIYASLS